jgi:hypothetical protein
MADCAAKLFAALRASNNRIRVNGILNQCCALVFVLESILLAQVLKFFLQQYRPKAHIVPVAALGILDAIDQPF